VAMIAMAASVTAVLLNSFVGQLLPKRWAVAERILTLKVQTIHCPGCVRIIQDTLGKLPGVGKVEGDVAQKRITVTAAGEGFDRQTVCAALEQIGHVCGEG